MGSNILNDKKKSVSLLFFSGLFLDFSTRINSQLIWLQTPPKKTNKKNSTPQ